MDETVKAGQWTVVARDRFEDERDPFYRIDDDTHSTEKDAEEAARTYLSDPTRKRYSGGEDDLYIVSPTGEKKLFKK